MLLGLSDCDGDGVVQYVPYAKVCKDFIEKEYQFDSMLKKN